MLFSTPGFHHGLFLSVATMTLMSLFFAVRARKPRRPRPRPRLRALLRCALRHPARCRLAAHYSAGMPCA
jgi:hypothetical protein